MYREGTTRMKNHNFPHHTSEEKLKDATDLQIHLIFE
jgi:hypothetical protein